MNGAFYIGATGLQSQQRALDVVANNIANINTPAFKRSEVRFSELLTPRAEQAETPTAMQPGMSGVALAGSPRVFTQGDLRLTGKPLDVAIQGEGFMELLGPAGQTVLWRGGALKVNTEGYLAAENGMPLKAMISLPVGVTAIAIDGDGKVQAQIAGEADPADVGQIDLVLARDIGGLTAIGDGLYRPADDADLMAVAPGEDGGGVFVQGSIETSNVQLSDEMVNLLLLQRAYAANAQVLQAGDQLMAIANNLKR